MSLLAASRLARRSCSCSLREAEDPGRGALGARASSTASVSAACAPLLRVNSEAETAPYRPNPALRSPSKVCPTGGAQPESEVRALTAVPLPLTCFPSPARRHNLLTPPLLLPSTLYSSFLTSPIPTAPTAFDHHAQHHPQHGPVLQLRAGCLPVSSRPPVGRGQQRRRQVSLLPWQGPAGQASAHQRPEAGPVPLLL